MDDVTNSSNCRRIRGIGVLLVLLLSACLESAARSEAIVVVARHDTALKELSRDIVADIFLGRMHSLTAEVPLIPLDSADAALREGFYKSVANMTQTRVKAYWSRLVFSGRGRPPPEVEPDAVDERLKEDVGTLTYLRAQQVTPSMKVLLELP